MLVSEKLGILLISLGGVSLSSQDVAQDDKTYDICVL